MFSKPNARPHHPGRCPTVLHAVNLGCPDGVWVAVDRLANRPACMLRQLGNRLPVHTVPTADDHSPAADCHHVPIRHAATVCGVLLNAFAGGVRCRVVVSAAAQIPAQCCVSDSSHCCPLVRCCVVLCSTCGSVDLFSEMSTGLLEYFSKIIPEANPAAHGSSLSEMSP
jgi:hypothetical protein